MWLTADEALRRLAVKPQTLYASVSRGRIAARADPADPRRSLYRAEDVDRLAARPRGRPTSTAVAAAAITWGEPILPTAISTVTHGRLGYRGHDAVELSRTATLEEIAGLLWSGDPPGLPATTATPRPILLALAERAATDPPSATQGQIALRREAASILAIVADALIGGGSGPLHDRLARHLGRPDAADPLRRALVLLAEHELNASTFAARVTVSTGASLAGGTLAGVAALSGPRHGHAASAISALAIDLGADPDTAEDALLDWLSEGRAVPGFGHRLYPVGDPRAAELLAHIAVPSEFAAFATAAEAVTGERPNIDFALAALTAAFGLPASAPMTIFILARTVGWLAHMLEQAATGQLIRPRARYTGPTVTKE
jgi:citrate synthase